MLLVVSAADLEKCLVLYSALAQLNLPMTIALTMVDAVKAGGGHVDDIGLQHELGVQVVPVVGTKGLGVGDVRHALTVSPRLPKPLEKLDTIEERFSWAEGVLERHTKPAAEDAFTRRLDAVLLHPLWGSLAFVVVMALFFQSIFSWAQPLMNLVEGGVGMLQGFVSDTLPPSIVTSFINRGLLAGVGSVIVFLPQILILNLLVTVLEESGYLARAAFLVDRFMGVFGLQGSSFIPLLGSFACAIPGIMSARIIPSYRDRLATIMAAPLMTCSARLPVYALLISSVIPATAVLGPFSMQAAVMAGLYAAGALSGLVVALALKRTVLRGAVVPFMIEFPSYRVPAWRSVLASMISRSREFLVTAGTVILAFSIALWVLTELPRAEVPAGTPPLAAQHLQLEQSFAADVGKAVQPVFAPLGFDWRLTLGVLSSYAARETFVSTMGQIYAADVSATDQPLRNVLQGTMPLAVGLSLLAFYVYALQCVSTIAIMRRETGSWKWPALAFVLTFAMAYGAALVTYTLTK
jgi:ferrous iron transport protein B